MLKDALTLSALIAAVLLVRAAFKNRVPKRLIYALWLVVLLKLCLPGTAYALPLLPAEQTAAAQQTETPTQSVPAAQQPTQAAAQPQTPAQQPVSRPPEAAKPAAAMPLVTEPVLVIWFCGSVLLGLWLLLTWLVFTVRRQCAGGKPAVLPVQFGIRQQQLLQGIRFRQAVIIHNPQILCPGTRCLLDAAGKAACTTQVFAGIIIVHGWQVQLRHQFGRAVRAGIIDHPQFRHTGRLGTQSPQAALQHCLAVIRYNNRCRAFHL